MSKGEWSSNRTTSSSFFIVAFHNKAPPVLCVLSQAWDGEGEGKKVVLRKRAEGRGEEEEEANNKWVEEKEREGLLLALRGERGDSTSFATKEGGRERERDYGVFSRQGETDDPSKSPPLDFHGRSFWQPSQLAPLLTSLTRPRNRTKINTHKQLCFFLSF